MFTKTKTYLFCHHHFWGLSIWSSHFLERNLHNYLGCSIKMVRFAWPCLTFDGQGHFRFRITMVIVDLTGVCIFIFRVHLRNDQSLDVTLVNELIDAWGYFDLFLSFEPYCLHWFWPYKSKFSWRNVALLNGMNEREPRFEPLLITEPVMWC